MRVLVIEGIASPTFGGAEKSMSSFCDYLKHQNDDVFLVCEKYDTSYAVTQEHTLVLNLQPFQKQGIISYLKTINIISKYVRDNKIDLVITHCIHNTPLLRLVKFRTRVKLLIYFKWVYNQSSIGRLNSWGLRGYDRYVAINEFVGKYWKSKLKNESSFELIPDGVDFPKEPFFNKPIRKTFNVLYFGRIFKGKGLHLLIEALAKLNASYQLTILGDFNPNDVNNIEFEYHNEIQNLIQKFNLEDRVIFVGLVDNVVAYINEASLVVVPSVIDDAQPFSVLEAFANGCPAIGTNRGGIPYLYENDEFWFCEPTSVDLAEKIESVLSIKSFELMEKTKIRYKDLQLRYNKSITEKTLGETCKSLIND
jgi:glycosyltransferase involved in cell wall biosynthesis